MELIDRQAAIEIYAGTLKKNGEEWQNKTDVTIEAIREVALYLLENDIEIRFWQGNYFKLTVSRLDEETEMDDYQEV